MESTVNRRLRRYALYFVAWTAVALFFFTQSLMQKFASGEPTPASHYLASWLVGIYLWALITPGVLWVGKRFPFARGNWLRRIALHLPLSVGVSIVQLVVEAAILAQMRIFPTIMKDFGSTLAFLLIIGFHQGVMTYWTILGAQAGFRYYRRYQERERQALKLELDASELKTELARAQLSALKMQLQPHFLFNTLNAIMVLVRQQKGPQAEEMVGRLSDLLRCVLEDVEAQEVPLRRELEYLGLYLAIEQVRFQDRLKVEIAVDPAALDAAVPHMGLQPLVENAIRHGIGRSSSAGRLQISAARVDGTLEIKVQDDGPGLPPAEAMRGRGIGLANTRARLTRLYGDAARLTVENGEQGGAVALMVLPYHVAPDASETNAMEVHAAHDTDR
jgi:sensor histidine kinase YesM